MWAIKTSWINKGCRCKVLFCWDFDLFPSRNKQRSYRWNSMRVFCCCCFVFWKYCCETLSEWVFFFETQNFRPQHCFIKSCFRAAVSVSTCFQSAALWVSHFNRAASAAAELLGCELSINKRVCVWPICTSQRSSFSSPPDNKSFRLGWNFKYWARCLCCSAIYIYLSPNGLQWIQNLCIELQKCLRNYFPCFMRRSGALWRLYWFAECYHASIRISSKPDVNISLSFL